MLGRLASRKVSISKEQYLSRRNSPSPVFGTGSDMNVNDIADINMERSEMTRGRRNSIGLLNNRIKTIRERLSQTLKTYEGVDAKMLGHYKMF